MLDRVDARTVCVSNIFENVEGPAVVSADREGRRPVSPNRSAGDILDEALCPLDILAKERRRQTVRANVIIAVAGKFMTCVRNASHHREMAFGNPAESEK